jgi:hypothetical protein
MFTLSPCPLYVQPQHQRLFHRTGHEFLSRYFSLPRVGNHQGKHSNTPYNHASIDRGFIYPVPFIFLIVQSYQVKISSCWQANFAPLAHRTLVFLSVYLRRAMADLPCDVASLCPHATEKILYSRYCSPMANFIDAHKEPTWWSPHLLLSDLVCN